MSHYAQDSDSGSDSDNNEISNFDDNMGKLFIYSNYSGPEYDLKLPTSSDLSTASWC